MFRRISCRLGAFAATPTALNAAPADVAPTHSNNAGGNRPFRRTNDNLQAVFEVTPRVDFRRAAATVSDGYFLRMQYSQTAVQIRRTAQSKAIGENSIFGGADSYLQLPAATISRMLAVMDGYLDECTVIGRQFHGTFKPSAEGPHTFVLRCTPTAAAAASKDACTEWSAEFCAGDSILLQRFLKASLHYMQGFYRSDQTETE